jgi:Transposase DDE domain
MGLSKHGGIVVGIAGGQDVKVEGFQRRHRMFFLVLHPHVVIDDAAVPIELQLVAQQGRESQLSDQRRAFPGATPRVRVDGGFAGNDWLDVLETQRVEYVVGLASNARLDHRAVKRMTRLMLGFSPYGRPAVRLRALKGQLVDMGGESPTPAKQFYALAA